MRWGWLVLLVAIPLAAMAEDALIYIASGTSQTLVLQEDGSYQARIPLTTAEGGPSLADLAVEKFDVQYKESRSPALFAAFTVTKEPATKSQDDALMIVCAADLLPGNYVITLHIVSLVPKRKKQSLVLTLSKPAPLVTPGPSLYIERTSALRGDPTIIPGLLRLTEDSHLAGMPIVALTADLDRKPGMPAAAGKLDFPSGTVGLEAGDSQDYLINPSGDFPPGSYSGKVTIRSPYLSGPISLNFNLLSRRSPSWLIVLAALGATLGLLVRVGLKRLLEREQALISASLTLETLKEARARIEEPDLRQKIDNQIKVLTKPQDNAPATITTASTAAATALQSIETEFQQRRTAFALKLDTLSALLAKRWILPRETAELMDAVSNKRDAAATALAHGNISAADDLLQIAIREPLLDAVTKAMHWRASFSAYLARFEAQHPALDVDVLQKLHAAVASAAAQVPDNLHPVAIAITGAETELTRTHGAYTGGRDFFAGLRTALSDFLSQAKVTLGQKINSLDDDWKPIELKTQELGDHLLDALETDLDVAAQRLAAENNALVEAWSALLKKRLSVEVFSAVSQSMSQGSWNAALAKAAEPPAVGGGHEADEVGVVSQPARAAAPQASQSSRFALALPNLTKSPELLQQPARIREFVLTGTADERLRIRKRTFWIELSQTMIVAVLFIAGLYELNSDTWIGTSKEMLSIFLLAFGADLSAEGVLALLRK